MENELTPFSHIHSCKSSQIK